MKFEFSKHAIEQMEIRKISKDFVEKILEQPEQISDKKETKVYQSRVTEGNKTYLIRVFVNILKSPNLVVTAYKTSNIKKYYENKI